MQMVVFTRNMTNNEPHGEKQDKALTDALIRTDHPWAMTMLLVPFLSLLRTVFRFPED